MSGSDVRAERRAAALRENLKRRKAQARAVPVDESQPGEPDDQRPTNRDPTLTQTPAAS